MAPRPSSAHGAPYITVRLRRERGEAPWPVAVEFIVQTNDGAVYRRQSARPGSCRWVGMSASGQLLGGPPWVSQAIEDYVDQHREDVDALYSELSAGRTRRHLTEWIDEIDACTREGRFMTLALMAAITIPDVLANIDRLEEKAGPRYRRWYDAWLAERMVDAEGRHILSAEECWRMRCALLHCGRTARSGDSCYPWPRSGWDEPSRHPLGDDDVLDLPVQWFVSQITAAGRAWLDSKADRDLLGASPYESVWTHPLRG